MSRSRAASDPRPGDLLRGLPPRPSSGRGRSCAEAAAGHAGTPRWSGSEALGTEARRFVLDDRVWCGSAAPTEPGVAAVADGKPVPVPHLHGLGPRRRVRRRLPTAGAASWSTSDRHTTRQLRTKLAEEYNDVARQAIRLVRRTRLGRTADRAAALSELASKFPGIDLVGSVWRVRGTGLRNAAVDIPLAEIRASQVPGLFDPADQTRMCPVRRAVESA